MFGVARRESSPCTSPSPDIACHWRESGTAIIDARGDLTQPSPVQSLYLTCDRALRQGATRLQLDLGKVQAADTKLIACLVAVLRLARRRHRGVTMNNSDAIQAWLGLCHVETICGQVRVKRTTMANFAPETSNECLR